MLLVGAPREEASDRTTEVKMSDNIFVRFSGDVFCKLSRSSAIDQVEWKIPTAVWEECGYVDKDPKTSQLICTVSKSNKRATMKLTDSVVSDERRKKDSTSGVARHLMFFDNKRQEQISKAAATESWRIQQRYNVKGTQKPRSLTHLNPAELQEAVLEYLYKLNGRLTRRVMYDDVSELELWNRVALLEAWIWRFGRRWAQAASEHFSDYYLSGEHTDKTVIAVNPKEDLSVLLCEFLKTSPAYSTTPRQFLIRFMELIYACNGGTFSRIVFDSKSKAGVVTKQPSTYGERFLAQLRTTEFLQLPGLMVTESRHVFATGEELLNFQKYWIFDKLPMTLAVIMLKSQNLPVGWEKMFMEWLQTATAAAPARDPVKATNFGSISSSEMEVFLLDEEIEETDVGKTLKSRQVSATGKRSYSDSFSSEDSSEHDLACAEPAAKRHCNTAS